MLKLNYACLPLKIKPKAKQKSRKKYFLVINKENIFLKILKIQSQTGIWSLFSSSLMSCRLYTRYLLPL